MLHASREYQKHLQCLPETGRRRGALSGQEKHQNLNCNRPSGVVKAQFHYVMSRAADVTRVP